MREGTLQKEIKALYSEKAEGQAFRDAMQQAGCGYKGRWKPEQAKRELKEVRHDLQAAMKVAWTWSFDVVWASQLI